MSLLPAASSFLSCDSSSSVFPSTAVEACAYCEDALGSMSDDGIAVEEVLCELANDPAMSSGGFGGLGGAIGVREDDGVLGGKL